MKIVFIPYVTFILVLTCLFSCGKSKDESQNKVPATVAIETPQTVDDGPDLEEGVVVDCDTQLYQIIKNSNFDTVSDSYYVRIDENRNDTLIIKAYVRNDLSDDKRYQQIVESAVSWFVILPQRDGIYQSMNALDPEEPDFKKLKIDNKAFAFLLKCIDQE
ncbi:MAG: hypothetical protein LBE34_15345 [Flavobacteriaceae bacterium]|jgi:hypothetical protein|nr:hypothetical protein [Flavobacteriaceae bacterium]